MAMMRFRVPNPSEFDPRFWQTAFVAGLDALPVASVNFLHDDELVLETSSRDSCKLSLPWPTRDFGPIVLSTASLRTNQPTYHLLLELARGTLHRIRTDAFFWDRAGVRIPNSHTELIDQAADVFVQAILEKDNPKLSDALAQQSIDLAISAARPLARAYVTQNLHARIRNNEKLQTLFGVRLPSNENWKDLAVPLQPACNTIGIDLPIGSLAANQLLLSTPSLTMDQLRWAKSQNLRVVAGPLVSPTDIHVIRNSLSYPSFENLLNAILEKARNLISQCQGLVQLWDACTGLNNCEATGLDDAQSLKLACSIINLIHTVDPKTPIIFSVDLPAAENMRHGPHAINPVIFAESLIRAHDRDIAGIGLELNLNYWPMGTLPMDLPAISDLIDHWSIQNRSLLIRLTTPLSPNSSSTPAGDPSADQVVSHWRYPSNSMQSSADESDDDTAPEISPSLFANTDQNQCLSYAGTTPPSGLEILQLLLAKQNVDAILWNQCWEDPKSPFKHSGLFGNDLSPRSLVECMIRLRSQYLP